MSLIKVDQDKLNAHFAAQVRAERDQLLAATDWTQAADAPEKTRIKWQPYRQALRDVPEQDGFPHNVVWPEKP